MSNGKHDRSDRRESKRTRKRSVEGWLSSELAALVGMRPRTIREYCERGVITKPVFRGRSTRYSREVFIRLLAIKFWRLDHGALGIDDLRARLARRTPQELEEWVLSRSVSAAVRAALTPPADGGLGAATAAASERDARTTALGPARGANGVQDVNVVGVGAAVTSNGAKGGTGASETAKPSGWQSVQLLTGLHLAVKRDAGPAAHKAFEHLQREFEAWLDRLVTGADG